MIMHKNDAFVAKIVNTRLTKIFIAIFAPDKRLPSSATLMVSDIHGKIRWIGCVYLLDSDIEFVLFMQKF